MLCGAPYEYGNTPFTLTLLKGEERENIGRR